MSREFEYSSLVRAQACDGGRWFASAGVEGYVKGGDEGGCRRAGVVGRDCVRLQSKWLENNRAACPVGTTGRKRASGARGRSEGKAESEKAKEKKRRNKTIARERGREGERRTRKNEEASEGSEKEKAICCMTGRIEATPRWQRIEKRLETCEGERERERQREGRERKRERGEEVGIIDADMCSSLGGSNP